mmetsp:Transcript_10240/g.15510  ORF Transcript_10240/g.15510 Transcript_10240/m.15510 type:complete len:346 (-) Transcript_10240:160-1197(-)|eukprot:CAMPEP_0185029676 /NCGR_PEP_ID=MMETSP1103-20130426/16111_1 /TAXON_ID=36769 /ORGANISM="Paraphysomonas bandaiensis, Strain Caron Lab Isolate" /LENGTH=345 /DNA_ID=CAMNT_0027564499 /DNA_START=35 /DNA_END=1072 /DNA_ORIENTATION=+
MAIVEDPRYKQGLKLLNENQFDEAADFFSELLQFCSEKYGDDSIEIAPVWLEYGRALLLKEQENPTDDLLGAMSAEAKKQAQALGAELNGGASSSAAEDENVDEDDGAGDDNAENEENEPNDMEIAWEALEVARRTFEREGDSKWDISLSEVYHCLGEVCRFDGNYNGSIDEYKKCVNLRESVCEDSDRLLAEAHYSLAVAYTYNAGEENPTENRMKAVQHHKKAMEVLQNANKKSPSEEIEDLIDEVKETIVELEKAIKHGSLDLTSRVNDKGASTTSIGFGGAASSFSSSSSSSSSITAKPATIIPCVGAKRARDVVASNESKKSVKNEDEKCDTAVSESSEK